MRKMRFGICLKAILFFVMFCTVLYIMTNKQNLMVIGSAGHVGRRKQLTNWVISSKFNDTTCKSDLGITSCKYSQIQLLKVDHITRTVEIGIHLYDGNNKKKTNGGDVILLWAKKLPSGGNAPGHVTDHMNGSYYGRIQVHWSGRTKISVKLASARENQCLRFRAMEKYGNSVFAIKTPYGIHYRFVNKSVRELTRCAPYNFVYGYESLCNFTSLNYGFSWFCGKPSKPGLDCNSYNKFRVKLFKVRRIVPNQPEEELIKNPGHCVFIQNLELLMHPLPKEIRKISAPIVKCSNRPKQDSWTESWPTGYAIKKNWKFKNCLKTVQAVKLERCLKNKRISFIGDSTLRQYLVALANALNLNIKSSGFTEEAHSKRYKIHLTWRKHEMPFHNRELYEQTDVRSTSFQVKQIEHDDSISGNSSIVVVHYGSHLQAFPPSVYRSRLRLLIQALERLLHKKPETTIFVRGAAPVIHDNYWFDVKISLIFNDILFQEFAHLQRHVIYLDVFSIYVANNNEILHPQDQTMRNQVQQFLAYIC